MMNFSERLRSEIDYAGYTYKEFASRADIKRRTLDTYLGVQQSMPPADIAVKIASTLGLSVEYLVTGKKLQNSVDISKYLQFRDILEDLSVLPDEILKPVKTMIKAVADQERK